MSKINGSESESGGGEDRETTTPLDSGQWSCALCSREFTLQRDGQRHGSSQEHEHSKMEVGVVFEPGNGVLSCHLPSGSVEFHELVGPLLYVVPAGTRHATRWNVRAEVLLGHIEQRQWNRVTGGLPMNKISTGVVRPAKNDLAFWLFATLLLHLWDEIKDGNNLTPKTVAGSLLDRAVKLIAGIQMVSSDLSVGLSPMQHQAMDDYIDRQIRFNLHTPDIAKIVGLSVPHLTTVIKRWCGLTPHGYVTRHKMLKAHQLLVGGNHCLSDVASAVGYDDSDHFSRKFRKFFSYPPRMLMIRSRSLSAKRPGKP